MREMCALLTRDRRVVPEVGRYAVDGPRTAVEFVVHHLRGAQVRGRFADVAGQIMVAEEPEDSHVEVEIRAASLDTGNRLRDRHLRSSAFLDVSRYPTIRFRSTAVRPSPAAAWEVVGGLTVRDITRPVQLRVDLSSVDPSTDVDGLALCAAGDLNRKDFGVTWNRVLETGGFLLGNAVHAELRVVATPVGPEWVR